jgi:hypothetical protein
MTLVTMIAVAGTSVSPRTSDLDVPEESGDSDIGLPGLFQTLNELEEALDLISVQRFELQGAVEGEAQA